MDYLSITYQWTPNFLKKISISNFCKEILNIFTLKIVYHRILLIVIFESNESSLSIGIESANL